MKTCFSEGKLTKQFGNPPTIHFFYTRTRKTDLSLGVLIFLGKPASKCSYFVLI